MTLKSGNEVYDIATLDRTIDSRCRRVFEDLISRRNLTHWDPQDIENFLLTPGKLVFKRITCTTLELPDAIAAFVASGELKNIVKLIICTHRSNDIALTDRGKDFDSIIASIPIPIEGFLMGMIEDEGSNEDSVTVHLIAICSTDQV
jgi:hypothetical protein